MSGFSLVMADKMNEAERGTVEISRETNNTISNVGNIAAATEELSATTSEIALRIKQSVEVARNTASAADQTTQTISDLAAQALKIGDIVQVDQRHRQQDQPACAQRHDRGRACWRGRRGSPWSLRK